MSGWDDSKGPDQQPKLPFLKELRKAMVWRKPANMGRQSRQGTSGHGSKEAARQPGEFYLARDLEVEVLRKLINHPRMALSALCSSERYSPEKMKSTLQDEITYEKERVGSNSSRVCELRKTLDEYRTPMDKEGDALRSSVAIRSAREGQGPSGRGPFWNLLHEFRQGLGIGDKAASSTGSSDQIQVVRCGQVAFSGFAPDLARLCEPKCWDRLSRKAVAPIFVLSRGRAETACANYEADFALGRQGRAGTPVVLVVRAEEEGEYREKWPRAVLMLHSGKCVGEVRGIVKEVARALGLAWVWKIDDNFVTFVGGREGKRARMRDALLYAQAVALNAKEVGANVGAVGFERLSRPRPQALHKVVFNTLKLYKVVLIKCIGTERVEYSKYERSEDILYLHRLLWEGYNTVQITEYRYHATLQKKGGAEEAREKPTMKKQKLSPLPVVNFPLLGRIPPNGGARTSRLGDEIVDPRSMVSDWLEMAQWKPSLRLHPENLTTRSQSGDPVKLAFDFGNRTGFKAAMSKASSEEMCNLIPPLFDPEYEPGDEGSSRHKLQLEEQQAILENCREEFLKTLLGYQPEVRSRMKESLAALIAKYRDHDDFNCKMAVETHNELACSLCSTWANKMGAQGA